jgi:hypothetical protein
MSKLNLGEIRECARTLQSLALHYGRPFYSGEHHGFRMPMGGSHTRTSGCRVTSHCVDFTALIEEVERLRALDEAVSIVRVRYPESVFLPDSDSEDAKSADMARRTCDSIGTEAERLLADKAGSSRTGRRAF